MSENQSLANVVLMVKDLANNVLPLMETNDSTTVEQIRAKFAEALTQFPIAEDITCQSVNAGGVPAEWIAAPNSRENYVMLYLHGGGYVFCSLATHRELVSRIARAAGIRALCVDYRLAPEYPFPAAVEDATTAYRWLLDTGISSEHIALAGDSAGGGLTLATLLSLRDAGDALPAAAVCLSPWVDPEAQGESMTTNADTDPLVTRELVRFVIQQYLGNSYLRNPLAAPLHADLQGLPPLLIQAGGAETLLDDAVRIARRCQEAGVDTELEIWKDMIHVWQLFASVLPEGQQAIEQIGEFIRKHVH
jgi:acetyl esterase/lipase